jgi:hypothetical protein
MNHRILLFADTALGFFERASARLCFAIISARAHIAERSNGFRK